MGQGVPTLGREDPTLDGGMEAYLWTDGGVPTFGHGEGVPTLDRGRGYLPWLGGGVPTLDGKST